jgi:hypothetical protein
MIFVKQSLHVTAYEAARTAIQHRSTQQDVIDRCNQVLAERQINGAVIHVTPPDLTGVNRGEDISVRITAPVRDNTVLRTQFFAGDLEAEATMVRE